MAHIVGREALMAWFDANNANEETGKPYWALYASRSEAADGRGRAWLKSDESPNISAKATRDSLERALGSMLSHNTKLFVRLRTLPNEPKNEAVTEYTHSDPKSQNFGIHGTQDVQAEVAKALEAYKRELATEQTIQNLKEEIKELKDSGFEAKIGSLLNHPLIQQAVVSLVPGIISKVAPTTPKPTPQHTEDMKVSINGTAPLDEVEQAEADKIEASVNELLEADPSVSVVLEKLAAIAKNKPELYAQYRPILLSL